MKKFSAFDFIQSIFGIDNSIDSLAFIVESSEIGQVLIKDVIESFDNLMQLRQTFIKEFLMSNYKEFYMKTLRKHVNCNIEKDIIVFSTESDEDGELICLAIRL